MSDSQEEQKVEIEDVPEQNQSHIKEILSKGKQIAPFYEEADLFKLFKSYYSVDYLFYQQLEIIAKRRKNQDSNDDGWISVGKSHVSTTTNHYEQPKKTVNRSNRPRYNFLEDKELISRALNFEKQLQAERQFKEKSKIHTQYKQKQENKVANNNQSNKYQQKREQKPQTEQKRKYKLKEEDKPKQTASVANGSKAKEQPITKTDISTQNKPPVSKTPVQVPQKVSEPQQKQSSEIKVQQKNASQKVKYQQKPVSVPLPLPKEKPAQQVQEQPKTEQPKPQSQQPKIQYQQKPAPKAVSTQKRVSIQEQEEWNANQSEKVYAQACRASPLLLGFVKPKQIVQRVSYIRYPDGKFSKISIRQTRTQRRI